MKRICFFLISLIFVLSDALAEHPIEVHRASAEGKFYEALKLYESLPRRKRGVEVTLEAAESAWALGLPEKAKELYNELLTQDELTSRKRARIFLARGIIEYQEGSPQTAIVYADRARQHIEADSPEQVKVSLLLGDAYRAAGELGKAREVLEEGLDAANSSERPEIHFRLGLIEKELANYEQAQRHLQAVPVEHARTGKAIRYLAEVTLENGQYDHAKFWLEKGRTEFPREFLDSWVDYALMEVAVQQEDLSAVETIRNEAREKFPPSDSWLTLLEASAERFQWAERGGL